MKKTATLLIVMALCLTMIFPATLVSMASTVETEALSFDFTNVNDKTMWGDDVVYTGTTLAPRSILFTNDAGKPNVTSNSVDTSKNVASITYNSSSVAMIFRSDYANYEHVAKAPITLKANTSYRIVANINTSSTAPTYFHVGVNDSQDNILGRASVTAASTSFKDFTSPVFVTGDSGEVNLTLTLKTPSQGVMARIKYIKIYEETEVADKVLTAKEEFKNYYHTFNFNESSYYGEPLTAGGTDYRSLDFANDAGKANVTNNGTVFYYTDNTRGGLRIKAGSAGTYTCRKDISLKPNTEYVMAVYGRLMTGGTFNIYCTDKSGEKITNSTLTVNNTDSGYYTSVFTTGDEADSKLVLDYIATGSGSGVVWNISLYPLKTSPVNGNFETELMTGWAQSNLTVSSISTSSVRGGNSMKFITGSVALTYYKAPAGKNTVYAWVKSNSNETVAQTAYIYKMPVGQCNTINKENLIASGSVIAPSNSGYKLIKFDFTVAEDTIVALGFAPTEKDFWADIIYSLPEGPAAADFENGLDGFVDTVVKADGTWRDQTVATVVETEENNKALFLDGTLYDSEAEKIIYLKPNTKYTVSLDVNVTVGAAAGESGAKPEIMLVDLKSTDSYNILKQAFYPNSYNGWEHHDYEITTGSDDAFYRIVLRNNMGSAAYYDNISVTEKLKGDIDGKDGINATDLSLMRTKLLKFTGDYDETYDINDDGKVDIRDLVAIKKKSLI